jgi:pSer/pThr/pTyr-binding forkhead associated (FHA) protein
MTETSDLAGIRNRPRPQLPGGAIPVTLKAPEPATRRSLPITQPVTLIGSRRDCDFPIPHPDVSKIHCVLVHTGSSVFVCDLRSRCGTYVNDAFAHLSELQPGVSIRVGSVPLEVEFGEPDTALAWAKALNTPALRLSGASEHAITQSATVIGRRNTCDVTLDAPDVSLAHALLLFLDGRPALCDLGSRSGTRINGSPITLAWLADGDEIQIGSHIWRVSWSGPIGFDAERPAGDAKAADGLPAPAGVDNLDLLAALESTGSGVAALLEPEPPLMQIDYRVGDIGQTIQALSNSLREAQQKLMARAAELDALQKELQRRADVIQKREELLAAREAGEKVAAEKIEQFKMALSLAQQLFQNGPTAGGPDNTPTTAVPVVRKPLFDALPIAAPSGNGQSARRNGHATSDRLATRLN